ncbi:MAG TPA: hypothetical protein VK582_04840 [Pyrinomonadaceae bacterium]|nr:hypothetical protein [Pyrinomonadaceae bacterium]
MFGNIDVKTRPLRLACLVDPNDAKGIREAIRLSSTLWGGSTFPIIQLYERSPSTWREKPFRPPSAKSVILGYLEAFDPDLLVQFSKTVPDFVSGLGLEIIKPGDIWKDLSEQGRRLAPQFGVGIFEILNDVFEKHFRYKPKYPVRIVIPRIPSVLPLFWSSFFGEVPSEISNLLDKHYREPLEIEAPKFKADLLSDIVKGNVFFPRRLTQYELEYRNRPRFGNGASIFFMDARKTEDVVDFWNLRASGRSVLPFPKQLLTSPQLNEVVTAFLRQHRRPWRHNPSVCDHASFIRSRNSTMQELQQYATSLKITPDPADESDSPFFSLQHWYPRIWDEWARDKDGASPADVYGREESAEISETSERKITFTPILPSFAEKYGYHGKPRCANEVSFRLYGETEFLAEVFPTSAGKKVANAISGRISLPGEWRVGRHGLVKLVKYGLSEMRDIPASEDVFFAWLEDRGWTPKLSTPGLIARQINRQLEGQPQYVLRNEKVLGLFEKMNGGLVKEDGSPVDDNRFVQERDLSIGEVKSRIGSPSLYEYLLSKGIFKLGARVQCSNCLRNSWFQLDNVQDALTCPRCLNSFPAVGHLDSCIWSYKTTGAFSLPNYADGAYAVLVTLKFFDDHNMNTMRTTPVVSFTAEAPHDKRLEADFASFWQESLYGEKKDGVMFGECKTYGRFERRDFDRMQYIAKTFPGAVLVFSTLRKSLTPKEVASLTRITKAGRKRWKTERPINPVLILTGTELLNS